MASAALLAGCGGSDPVTTGSAGGAGAVERLSLTLDFAPNAVHAGIYLAQDQGRFTDARVDLRVRVPSSGADGARLLAAGRTDLAIMTIHDIALARQAGADLVAVAALVHRPLGSVIAGPGIERPRDLERRTVGMTGLPSDDAVFDQIVRGDGGDPSTVRRRTIGFDAVGALLSERVDAAIGFWNAEGVALRSRRPGTRVFRVDRFGAPSYPELLVVSTSKVLADRGDAVGRFVRALDLGQRTVSVDDDAAVDRIVRTIRDGSGDRSIDPATTAEQLRAVAPAMRTGDGRPGVAIDRTALRRWAAWEARVGITDRAPDVDALVWEQAPGS